MDIHSDEENQGDSDTFNYNLGDCCLLEDSFGVYRHSTKQFTQTTPLETCYNVPLGSVTLRCNLVHLSPFVSSLFRRGLKEVKSKRVLVGL